jgi:hypothetical protein
MQLSRISRGAGILVKCLKTFTFGFSDSARYGFDEVKFAGTFDDYAACRRLNGLKAKISFLSTFPPADCERRACPLMFLPTKNWFAGLS